MSITTIWIRDGILSQSNTAEPGRAVRIRALGRYELGAGVLGRAGYEVIHVRD